MMMVEKVATTCTDSLRRPPFLQHLVAFKCLFSRTIKTMIILFIVLMNSLSVYWKKCSVEACYFSLVIHFRV